MRFLGFSCRIPEAAENKTLFTGLFMGPTFPDDVILIVLGSKFTVVNLTLRVGRFLGLPAVDGPAEPLVGVVGTIVGLGIGDPNSSSGDSRALGPLCNLGVHGAPPFP